MPVITLATTSTNKNGKYNRSRARNSHEQSKQRYTSSNTLPAQDLGEGNARKAISAKQMKKNRKRAEKAQCEEKERLLTMEVDEGFKAQ